MKIKNLFLLLVFMYLHTILAQATSSIWINTKLFDKTQNPATLTQEQYLPLFNQLFHSKEDWQQIKMEKEEPTNEAHQSQIVTTCAEYAKLKKEGYQITTPHFSSNYTGSGIEPDQIARCEMLILMQQLKPARTSYLQDFTFDAEGLKQLPASLAPTFTEEGLNELELATQQSKSLWQVLDIDTSKILTAENLEGFIREITVFGTNYPPLILDNNLIVKFKNTLRTLAQKAELSAEVELNTFKQMIKTAIPEVKIFPGTCYVENDWPEMPDHCLSIYRPGDDWLGFIEVARGDFTGHGQEEILLWRYWDILPGGGHGPSLNNDWILLTRDTSVDKFKVLLLQS